MACRVCEVPLNHFTDLITGTSEYRHARISSEHATHEPEPVPIEEVGARVICDFCSEPHVLFQYDVGQVDLHIVGQFGQQIRQFDGAWSACAHCFPLVEARDAQALAEDCVRRRFPSDPIPTPARDGQRLDARSVYARRVENVRIFHAAALDVMKPGRAIPAALGAWEPTPLPAQTLPKVRDRLARMLTTEAFAMRGLDDPRARERVASGLRAARLHWVDEEFTDLTAHAAIVLPETALTAQDAPAAHGFIAWAAPVGSRQDITAASWTITGGSVTVVCYRSIGHGLDGETLQSVREQAGWLAPVAVRQLDGAERVDADSPLAPLVASWLLIAQKVAETSSATVDRRVRKDYKRAGRAEPEVLLVRIRGSVPATSAGEARPNVTTSSDPSGGRGFRWWVRGHWRNQPYGRGREQRRLIYIDPHLRGEEGKPVKASTTVRVLGSVPSRPGPSDG